MAVRYRFLASEQDHHLVIDWFSALGHEMTVQAHPDGIWFYFRAMATQALPDAQQIDQKTTPLVWVSTPRKRQDLLWTDAEVCFTATPLKSQFPQLHRIALAFATWLKQFDLVFSRKDEVAPEWSYYLEGGLQNSGDNLYALPQAMDALRNGRYFVSHGANDTVVDTVAKALRLRGHAFDTHYPV
ncbi:hypothetical protein [Janthinobacterium psychrotolerans]|uniref:Uncharacterized protein n=1 Tax=Janthinobacterium psychrotolerans TaxID=1747903 RepID=A0A1A7C8D7_9BURK|nr:hypothetical protein [Janthinobacterium psychrotolerans]OBV41279.1 hypothetical protein ASR47_102735 [Janthinobacterium psychrotolerans]